MADINLLPPDLTPNRKVVELANTVKKVSAVGYLVTIMLMAVGAGAFLILSQQLQTSRAKQEELKRQIYSLQQTEQRLILVKDRLAKVKGIWGKDSNTEEIETFQELIPLFPEGYEIRSVVFSEEQSQTAFVLPNSRAVVEFFAKIVSSGLYSKIQLQNFSLNKDYTYGMQMNLVI